MDFGKMFNNELKRESGNYKEFIKYIRDMPKEMIKDILLITPKFVLLLIKLLKSKEVDSELKILFTGIIIVLSTLLGYVVWNINMIAIFITLAASFGITTTIIVVFFSSLVLIVKSAMIALITLVAMYLCNTVITTEELKELAIDAFGEKEGESFIEKFYSILKSIDNSIEKFILPIRNFFIKIGKKFGGKNLNDNLLKLEEKIEKKMKK